MSGNWARPVTGVSVVNTGQVRELTVFQGIHSRLILVTFHHIKTSTRYLPYFTAYIFSFLAIITDSVALKTPK